MPDVKELIQLYFDAFNRNDSAGLLALLTDDVVHDINEGPREVGIEAFRRFKAHMDECYSEQITDLIILGEGDRGAAEFTCSGVYLKTDGSLPEAKGQTYSIWAGAFFEAREGRISRITSCYSLKGWIEAVSA